MASTAPGSGKVAEMTPEQRSVAISALEALQAEHDRMQEQVRIARRKLLEHARTLSEQLHETRKALVEGSIAPSEARKVAKDFAKSATLAGWSVEPSALPAPKEASEEEAAASEADDTKPCVFSNFWLTALQNHPLWAEMIEEYDEPIMAHLVDVRCRMHDDWKGFTMTWYFSENPYFSNKTLEKSVLFANEVDGDGRVSVRELTGTKINWFPGKDVTVAPKKAKKGKKGKGGGSKVEERDSVFRYMSNSLNPEELFESLEDPEEAEMLQDQIHMEIELADAVRESIGHRAIKWFLGEVELESDDEGYVDEDDDEDDDEEEDEEDDEDKPKKRKGRRGHKCHDPHCEDEHCGEEGEDMEAVRSALANAFGDSSANPFATAGGGDNPFASLGGAPAPAPGGAEEPKPECKQQ